MIVKATRTDFRNFVIDNGLFVYGNSHNFDRLADLVEGGIDAGALADALWLFSDVPAEEKAAKIAGKVELRFDADAIARKSRLAHPRLVAKIVEVARWTPAITQKVTPDNVVLLESSGKSEVDGEEDRVVFSVNGFGYFIDFEDGTAGRNDAYDEKKGE